jgi:hypothetical protein
MICTMLVCIAVLVPVFAHAQNFVPLEKVDGTPLAQVYGSDVSSALSLSNLINNFFKIALAVGAVLAVLQIVHAGYLYMVSEASAGSKSRAKEVFGDAIIGLLLLMSIYLILYQINPCILRLDILRSLSGGECDVRSTGNVGDDLAIEYPSNDPLRLGETSGVQSNTQQGYLEAGVSVRTGSSVGGDFSVTSGQSVNSSESVRTSSSVNSSGSSPTGAPTATGAGTQTPSAPGSAPTTKPAVSLTATPASVASGGLSLLSWSSVATSRCYLYAGELGKKSVLHAAGTSAGRATSSPLTATTVFTVECTATDAGAATSTDSVFVTVQ